MSLVYSISGTIASKIIIAILNSIYYENILEKETNEKCKYLLKNLKKFYTNDIYGYSRKCRTAFLKMNSALLIKDMHQNIVLKLEKKNKKLMAKNRQEGNILAFENSIRPHINNTIIDISEISKFYRNYNYNFDESDSKIVLNTEDIFAPKPYYENISISTQNKGQEFKTNFEIVSVHSVSFKRAIYKSKRKINYFMCNISEFSYVIKNLKKDRKVTMTSLNVINKLSLNEERRIQKKKSHLKIKVFMIIIISSFIILFIMITDIYKKYGNNIQTICISPFLSVVLTKLFITQNLMIFIHTFFMYKFGEKFYTDHKISLNPLRIIFKYVIPQISKSNHQGVIIFRKFLEKTEQES